MLNLMQRVCWNTRGWQLPSGATTEKGFPGENGFGHEEWNFQIDDVWNGFIFPYIYQIPQQRKLKEHNGKFNIGFFTRHQERNQWFFIGIHHGAELISEEEYSKIIKEFKSHGIFERRAEELFTTAGSFKTKKAALKEVMDAFRVPYIRVKIPVSGVEMFPQPIPIDKPGNVRFKSFTYIERFPSNKISNRKKDRQQKSALAEDGYFRESPGKLSVIIPKHNELSNNFVAWLGKMGISAKQEENYIDVLFEDGGVSYIAELKVIYGVGTTKSIRESLGQLLEYNYYPGRSEKKEWMIVLDQQPLETDKEYVANLVSKFNIRLRVGWLSVCGFEFFPEWRR